jgi:hypothetical protein
VSDVDVVVGDAGFAKGGDGAVEELSGDGAVPLGDDDGEAIGGVGGSGMDDGRHVRFQVS